MKTIATITPELETLTPEEFVARVYSMCDIIPTTPADYFIRNLDTEKLELHISKEMYATLDDDTKQALWADFRWSRRNGCWVQRTVPGYTDYEALWIFAKHIGLADGGYFVTLHMDAPADSAKSEPAPAPVAPVKAEPQPKAEITPASKAKRPETIPAADPKPGAFSTEEIEHALHIGSGFADGKIRIAAFYASNHTPDEAKKFLKEEYGIGGRSHDFLDGSSGFVDYNANGITIRRGYYSDKDKTEVVLSWVSVNAYLHDMMRGGRYLTQDEQAKFNAISKQYRGKLPTPNPRMQYPLTKMGA